MGGAGTLAGLVRNLRAKNRRERVLFWTLTGVLLAVLAILAFTSPVGFVRPLMGWIPEVQPLDIWDLNPVLWLPYYLAGHLQVGWAYGLAVPPQEYLGLLALTIVFWVFVSAAVSKVVALLIFRTRAAGVA